MRVLKDGGGTWLISDNEVFISSQYDENGWEWEPTGQGFMRCGVTELFDDIEINGDAYGECDVTISYLLHKGGARYDRIKQRAHFSGCEMVGQWEDVE